MDEIHVHKTKKSICAHFAESPCKSEIIRAVKSCNDQDVYIRHAHLTG